MFSGSLLNNAWLRHKAQLQTGGHILSMECILPVNPGTLLAGGTCLLSGAVLAGGCMLLDGEVLLVLSQRLFTNFSKPAGNL